MISSVGSAGASYSEMAARSISQANDMLETATKMNIDQSERFLKFAVTTGEKMPAGSKGANVNTYA